MTAGIVFTDLDGTLLDHESYSYRAAEPALAALTDSGIPLILASSKTAAEIAPLRDELGFTHCPAIVENGAGLLGANAGAEADQSDYQRLLDTLNSAPEELRAGFVGFHEWDAAEIAARTGLLPHQAALAGTRAFSEPGLLQGRQGDALLNWLAERGVSARKGGRFVTLSFGASKRDQMEAVLAGFAARPISVALGDAPNDVEMLGAADYGVIIANPAHEPLPQLAGEDDGRIIRTNESGPAGWNDAVLHWLERILPPR